MARRDLAERMVKQWRNPGGAGGGAGAPPIFVENDECSEILTYKRAKNSLFECKLVGGGGGGGGCRKFESFVGNLEGFAPPRKSEFQQLW